MGLAVVPTAVVVGDLGVNVYFVEFVDDVEMVRIHARNLSFI